MIFFSISILITILTQTDMLYLTHLVFAHLTCFCTSCLAHLVLHFSLFYYTFYSLFLFFTYIYALVWCYFYIIFILCTVHWADLIWSTFQIYSKLKYSNLLGKLNSFSWNNSDLPVSQRFSAMVTKSVTLKYSEKPFERLGFIERIGGSNSISWFLSTILNALWSVPRPSVFLSYSLGARPARPLCCLHAHKSFKYFWLYPV